MEEDAVVDNGPPRVATGVVVVDPMEDIAADPDPNPDADEGGDAGGKDGKGTEDLID